MLNMVESQPTTVDFIICSPFPAHRGGREVWLSHIAPALAAMPGIRVRIWALRRTGATAALDYGADRGVELQTVRSLSSTPLVYRALRLALGRYRALVDWYTFSRNVSRSLVRSRPPCERNHVIVAVGSVVEGLAAQWLRRRSDAPAFICSVRGRAAMDTVPYYGPAGRIILGWEGAAFHMADLILANGSETVEYVRSRGFQALLQPNGVDFALFSGGGAGRDPEDADHVMGDRSLRYILSTCTVGDAYDIRGVGWRLRSLPTLRRIYGDDFRLIFIGAGDGHQYRGLINDLNIGHLVQFCGQKKNVAAFLKRADVVTCLFTRGAGLTHSALEAMAAGRPIVATDNDIYRQMLEDDKTALLVPPNDDKALAGALAELLSNPQRGLEMGRRAQEVARQYDWPLVAAKLVENVQLALERRRETPGESREAGEV